MGVGKVIAKSALYPKSRGCDLMNDVFWEGIAVGRKGSQARAQHFQKKIWAFS